MDPIVISRTDCNTHGCPYCNHTRVFFRMGGNGTTLYRCSSIPCERSYLVVEDDLTRSSIGFGGDGTPTSYPLRVPHPRPFGRLE